MYQRPHTRSPRAARKDYRVLSLPVRFDPAPVLAELAALEPEWLPSQWKWHLGTDFCILRGGPPTGWPGGELTSGAGVDTPLLAQMPETRALLDTLFPVPAVLAWIGRSPPGARIRLHVDNTRHWDEHHRVHLPLRTHPGALLCVRGRFAHLEAGRAWVIDNSAPHGVTNDGPERLHLMVDLPDVPEVRDLLGRGVAVDGEARPDLLAELSVDPLEAAPESVRADADLMRRLRQQ